MRCRQWPTSLFNHSYSVVGGVGAAGLFLLLRLGIQGASQIAGAPVEVDISKLEPGQLIRVEWRGKPVWVINRTPKCLSR